MKFGSYLYDPDSSEGKSNGFVVIGIAAEYSIVSYENFKWYAGAGFNGASLQLEERYEIFGIPFEDIYNYTGGGFRMNTGVLWFFTGTTGLNFNLGFDSHNFTLQSVDRNGQKQDLSNIEGKLTVTGMDGTIGLVFRF